MKSDVLKAGLKAIYYTGAHRLLAPYTQGAGLIFMLHQVNPSRPSNFSPNGILTVTPEFLDAVITQVRAAGLDIVSLDEARERLIAGKNHRRFACFTLDDGYRDNMDFAYPVFARHDVPFTVYVPSDFAAGKGELWWLALERVISGQDRIDVELKGEAHAFPTASAGQKQAAFHRIYWWLRSIDEDRQREFMADLCVRYKLDQTALCRELILSWDELRDFSKEPLVTIGAHTVAHFAVAKLPLERAHEEMQKGAERLEKELGQRPEHFSFPYGDSASAGKREFEIARDLGFKTAVTTRKGMLFPEHKDHLTALPRVSLNGAYQSLLYTQLYLSGAPFALWNAFKKVDAA